MEKKIKKPKKKEKKHREKEREEKGKGKEKEVRGPHRHPHAELHGPLCPPVGHTGGRAGGFKEVWTMGRAAFSRAGVHGTSEAACSDRERARSATPGPSPDVVVSSLRTWVLQS